MNKKYFSLLILLLGGFPNIFSQKNMKIQTKEIINISFPSGSGVGYHGGKFYAIGDDSPFLYIISEEFAIEEKIPLIETQLSDFKGDRIKKKIKPDFETLEIISDKELIIFGSGSKSPTRDIFVRVLLGEKKRIEKYSISAFYEFLKKNPLFENSELNIEATAFYEGFLYLFNRVNNVIIKADYQQFTKFLSDGILPQIEVKRVSLPKIDGFEAGFSGATFLDKNTCVFTASVEATDDAYNDGEIIGSLVGTLNMADFQKVTVSNYEILSSEIPLKVESVTLLPSKSTEKIEFLLISDDDKGGTTFVKKSIKHPF